MKLTHLGWSRNDDQQIDSRLSHRQILVCNVNHQQMLLLRPTHLLSQTSQLYQKFQLKMIKGTFLKRKGHNSCLQVSKRHVNRKKASYTTKSELHTRFSHFSIQEEQKLIDKDTTAMWLSKKEREKHVQCMPVY